MSEIDRLLALSLLSAGAALFLAVYQWRTREKRNQERIEAIAQMTKGERFATVIVALGAACVAFAWKKSGQ